MAELSVTVTGVDETQANLAAVLPAAQQAAVEAAAEYIATPRGDGLGVQNNALSATVGDGMASVSTTLNWPRTKGTSWAARGDDDFAAAEADIEAAAQAAVDAAWTDA